VHPIIARDARERSAVEAEERARADLYRLLAQLWVGPPDRDLLQRVGVAAAEPTGQGSDLEATWRALAAAMRSTSVEAAADEYDALFLGVGKPEIFLYGSYYLAGSLNERPLALLRGDLRTLGLARDEARGETEDHVAFLFEAMHFLIVGDDVSVCNLEQQRRFFRAHLQPWVGELCDAVDAQPRAVTWRAVADLTRSFMQIEAQAFDLLDA
jgi:TorA maturation chaperone TorD